MEEEHEPEVPHSRLFVLGGLGVPHQEIKVLFGKYGFVKNVYKHFDKKTQKEKGVFYVTYTKASDAALALEELNGTIAFPNNDFRIRVMIAADREKGKVWNNNEQDDMLKLCVKLPPGASEGELKETFQKFGQVNYVSIPKKKTGEVKDFAIVKFFRPYHAALALENCDPSFEANFQESSRPSQSKSMGAPQKTYSLEGSRKGFGGTAQDKRQSFDRSPSPLWDDANSDPGDVAIDKPVWSENERRREDRRTKRHRSRSPRSIRSRSPKRRNSGRRPSSQHGSRGRSPFWGHPPELTDDREHRLDSPGRGHFPSRGNSPGWSSGRFSPPPPPQNHSSRSRHRSPRHVHSPNFREEQHFFQEDRPHHSPRRYSPESPRDIKRWSPQGRHSHGRSPGNFHPTEGRYSPKRPERPFSLEDQEPRHMAFRSHSRERPPNDIRRVVRSRSTSRRSWSFHSRSRSPVPQHQQARSFSRSRSPSGRHPQETFVRSPSRGRYSNERLSYRSPSPPNRRRSISPHTAEAHDIDYRRRQAVERKSRSFERRSRSLDRRSRSLERRSRSFERRPTSLERRPRTLEKIPISEEKRPNSMERRPRSMERRPRSMERRPRSMERRSRSVERRSRSMERRSRSVERRSRSKVSQRSGSLHHHHSPLRDGRHSPYQESRTSTPPSSYRRSSLGTDQGPSPMDILQNYRHDGERRIHLLTPLVVTHGAARTVADLVPGLVNFRFDEKTSTFLAEYSIPQSAAYAKERLDGFEYLPGFPICVWYYGQPPPPQVQHRVVAAAPNAVGAPPSAVAAPQPAGAVGPGAHLVGAPVMVTPHPSSNPRPMVVSLSEKKCPVPQCGQASFPSAQGFLRHWNDFHERHVKVRVCNHCGTVFKKLMDLRNHLVKEGVPEMQIGDFLRAPEQTINNSTYVDPGIYQLVSSSRNTGVEPTPVQHTQAPPRPVQQTLTRHPQPVPQPQAQPYAHNFTGLVDVLQHQVQYPPVQNQVNPVPVSHPDDERVPFCNVLLPRLRSLASPNTICCMRLFIMSSPDVVPMNILQDTFSRFGNLINAYFVPGKTCGYARYGSTDSARAAVARLNGAELYGQHLRVEIDTEIN